MSRRVVVLLFSLPVAACTAAQQAPDAPAPAPPAAVWPDEGPATWAPRATGEAITADDLRTRLYAFAHDSMRGRRVGEPGNVKGTDYIAREFARLGLRPAGENGTWFQALPFGPVGFDTARATLRVGATPLAPRTEWIPVAPTAANGYASGVNLAEVPTVFAGYVGDTGVVLDAA